MAEIMPRLRGRAYEVPGGWSWTATITIAPVEVIANLPAVDAQLVHEPGALDLSSPEVFPSKKLALVDLEKHVEGIKGVLAKTLSENGLPVSGFINFKTGNFERRRH